MKLTVIGSGGWGTALAMQAARKYPVVLWGYSREEMELFEEKRENVYYLPGVTIPDNITLTHDPEIAARSDVLLFVPPSKFFRNMAQLFKPYVKPNQLLASATKGFEYPSEKRMSEILEEEFPANAPVTVLSGPTHAEEVSRGVPTSMVAACRDEERAKVYQKVLSNESFRIYTNTDVIGVEVSAAVKNGIAIAAGALRGMGFGDNTMAALITRGLAEIRRLGLKLGAEEATFAGLAGVGDLIVTCVSRHSRNGRVGEGLAQGKSLDEILSETKMVAEGVEAVKSLVKFEKELGIEMPISHAVYDALYHSQDPRQIIRDLMVRPLKSERH